MLPARAMNVEPSDPAPATEPDAPAPPRPLYSTFRFIARHVSTPRAAVAVFIAAGFLAWIIATAVLLAIAGVARFGFIHGLDEQALLWFFAHRTPLLTKVMARLTTLGDGIVVLMVALVAATLLMVTRHRGLAVVLLAAVIGGKVVNNLLKLLFARPRPDIVEWATDVSSASFPSGHAMSAMIVYGTLTWAVTRLEATPALRATTWAVAALVILGIGVSRVYLGVHYPSDVIGGFAAGAAWVLFMVWTAEAVRYFRAPRAVP